MIDQIKQLLKNNLEKYYNERYNVELSMVVEEPKNATLGDISIPLFTVVKALRKPMPELVNEAVEVIKTFDLPILDIKPVSHFFTVLFPTPTAFPISSRVNPSSFLRFEIKSPILFIEAPHFLSRL